MQYRTLGRTGWSVSTVSFGAWAIGGSWGRVRDEDATDALHGAFDLGVNFVDTADVYGDGRSERLVASAVRARRNRIYVATKAGRRLQPHTAEGYNRANLEAFVDRSRTNLGVDTIDLLQLHCPPTAVYMQTAAFDALDELVAAKKIQHYGVSVETVDEALTAIRKHPRIQSVQIIFNLFRHKPADALFDDAQRREVGILARVPLASGLLTGKITAATQFGADDHRTFNRHGEFFDVGETFSGVDFDTALRAVEEIRAIVPSGMTMAQFALRAIGMFPAVTCSIPGAKNREQAEANARAADLPALTQTQMDAVRDVYDRVLRDAIHSRW